MSLSTHVLDTSIGAPVPELPVRLDVRTGDGWRPVADDHTDEDGRIGDLPTNAGVYRLVFDTSGYGGFHPEITVCFRVSSADEHNHVPLLLSPFGYTTYGELMDVRLGANQYGKAEVRLVRVDRGADEHRITDLNVSTSLAGDLAATHLLGDNAGVLPTDTQKNTVYAFARDGIGSVEEFALRLARHFVDTTPTIHRARVHIDAYTWSRLAPHSFMRGSGTCTTTATYDGSTAWVVSGVDDLVVLNTTGSEFHGFHRDQYTTLPETNDRILATAVTASWRHVGESDWDSSHETATRHLLEAFADTHSLSLQQTLHAMGERVLRECPELAEVRLTLPNKHHFLVDLSPFELDNPGEVFHAADRPYGLIEGSVVRDGAPDVGLAWW